MMNLGRNEIRLCTRIWKIGAYTFFTRGVRNNLNIPGALTDGAALYIHKKSYPQVTSDADVAGSFACFAIFFSSLVRLRGTFLSRFCCL